MSAAVADEVLLYPLSRFRQAEGEALPAFEVLEGAAVPEPYRGLLVHEGDMTSRLEDFHGGAIVLEILHREAPGRRIGARWCCAWRTSGKAVEYGAIEINLAAFPEALRARIIEGHLPLGGLLKRGGDGVSEPAASVHPAGG